MTESEKSLQEYKNDLKKTLEKSQDSFEKQLSFISAGSFGITIAFIEKVVGKLHLAQYTWIIILAWSLLALTFIINLFSHVIATKFYYKTIEEIDSNKYKYHSASKRVKKVNIVNAISICTLLLGITFIIIFIALNI